MNFTESHWSVDLIPMNGSLPEMVSDDSGFDLTNRMEHQAKPICNDKSLSLALDCDNCDAGYPKVDLCIQWTESQFQNESFKCKINCGPGYEVSGSNKVKCKDGQWKHELKSIDMKTCVKKIT